MTLNDLRGWSKAIIEPLAIVAERSGASPNQLSALSLAFAAASAVFYYLSSSREDFLYWAALMVLLNAALDVADGALARRIGKAEPKGDFLDHVIDRYSDMFILGGIIVAGYVYWFIGLLTVIGVLITSYIGAEAQAFQLGRYYGGIMGRADRLTAMFLATLINAIYPSPISGLPVLGWAVVAIMLSSHITALQRFRYIWKRL